MMKIINPIMKKTYGGRSYRVFLKIDFNSTPQNMHPEGYFSISGVEGPLPSGNALEGCGQIDIHLKKEDRAEWKYLEGFNDKIMDQIFDIWGKWHLKDISEIPEEVKQFILSLPDTKAEPAWI